ncbi:MAG: hypothetical protein M0Z45_01845 [Actinomycetota bacterium]|nr:hypothetical protein [Actinomycetota bacterium]
MSNTELRLAVERRLHAALFIRDASGLDIEISAGVPPEGAMFVSRQTLPTNLNTSDAAIAWLA